MIDLRIIGKNGLIIQYDDIISMIGFNVAKYYKSKGLRPKLNDMKIDDVLLSYIDRTTEDYSKWLKNEFDIDVNPEVMLSSFLAMQPNLVYAYRLFPASHQEKIDQLFIYSEKYSSIIDQSTESFGFKGIKCINGDIKSYLEEHPNCTFITASIDSINKCLEVKTPVCLVVCDDYLYTMKYISDNSIEERMRDKGNIMLRYTSVISAGLI